MDNARIQPWETVAVGDFSEGYGRVALLLVEDALGKLRVAGLAPSAPRARWTNDVRFSSEFEHVQFEEQMHGTHEPKNGETGERDKIFDLLPYTSILLLHLQSNFSVLFLRV